MKNSHRKKLIYLLSGAFIAAALFFALGSLAYAQAPAPNTLGLNEVGRGLGQAAPADIRVIVAQIIRVALGLLGIVAVGLIIYAGYTYMTAGGNEEKITEAKKIIGNAVIGLVIILTAYAIVSFVISRLLEATTGVPAHCFNNAYEPNTEENIDCGKECPACGGGGGNLNNLLLVSSLPASGQLCVRNFKPAVVFTKNIDIGTLGGNAVVMLVKDGSVINGVWQLGSKNNVAIFTPEGSCAPDQGNDCLASNTNYTFVIKNPGAIKSADGKLTLNCAVRGCGPVSFTTGNIVSRAAPFINIDYPGPSSLLAAGASIPVKISYDDKGGMQNVLLSWAASTTFAATQKFGNLAVYPIPHMRANAYSDQTLHSVDVDNDAKLDIVANTAGASLDWFKGKGDGAFLPAQPIPLKLGITDKLAMGDFNLDKKLDFIEQWGYGFYVWLGNGDGTFKMDPTFYRSNNKIAENFIRFPVVADLNNDGYPDLFFSATNKNGYPSRGMATFLNNKNNPGAFTLAITSTFNYNSAVTAIDDFSGDGKPDLLVVEAGKVINKYYVYLGNGDGTWQEPKAYLASAGSFFDIASADFNRDGKKDFAVSNWRSGKGDAVSVYLGNGNGAFAEPVEYPVGIDPNNIDVADFDGDGKLDIAVSLYNNNSNTYIDVLYGKGNGAFNAYTRSPVVGVKALGRGLTSGDYNGDGMADAAEIFWPNSNPLNTPVLFSLGALMAQKSGANNPFNFIGSQSFNNCQTSGAIEIAWPTGGLSPDSYFLLADALDQAGNTGEDVKKVTLKPAHCFDNILQGDELLGLGKGEKDPGPPACGGECGACAGGACSLDSDCAGGFCEILPGEQVGICVDKMRINSFTPSSGAAGTYVSIDGYYFGPNLGSVYFAIKNNPRLNAATDWKLAPIVKGCGDNFNNWNNWQIIAEVPKEAVNGPIKVETAGIEGTDANGQPITRRFTDVTNDNWGPALTDYKVTNEIRPGVACVLPNSGAVGDSVMVKGKNFGLLDNADDAVWFGQFTSKVGQNDWFDSLITATVPSMDAGVVSVKVTSAKLESNGARFTVKPGVAEDRPQIFSITPNNGPAGQYLTITGKNFGSKLGQVWFKATANSEDVGGDEDKFNFPVACASDVWSDTKIIVKFPPNRGELNVTYFVQVSNSVNNKFSPIVDGIIYKLSGGEPAPGLCKISPLEGPAPFAVGQKMVLDGEYFGDNPTVYYFKDGASPIDINGRAAGLTEVVSPTELKSSPPAGAASGPVAVWRPIDKQLSNGLPFTVSNCVKEAPGKPINTCADPNYNCCVSGDEAGLCVAKGELCAGEKRSTGYVWRFTTREIPEIPRVVERCEPYNELKPWNQPPTPSPNVLWKAPGSATSTDDQYNVCNQALINAEFSAAMDAGSFTLFDPNNINSDHTVRVIRCDDLKDGNTCVNPWEVNNLDPSSNQLYLASLGPDKKQHQYLQIKTINGKWETNKWYQVVLGSGIKSAAGPGGSIPLGNNRPCSIKDVSVGGKSQDVDGVYCFTFKTDDKDCKLKALIITPTSFWTQVLEAPIKIRDGQNNIIGDLQYRGTGLSKQTCILMDLADYNWLWSADDRSNLNANPPVLPRAEIFGVNNNTTTKVTALANTVNVNLTNPNDAVKVMATVAPNKGTETPVAGFSPLTIDMSRPEVIDWWPKCLEACTNAEVGLQFNTTMSNLNLPGAIENGTVQLLKCNDENCANTTAVLNSQDVILDQESNYTILKLANSRGGSVPLEVNTDYKVIISHFHENSVNANDNIWSAARFNDPATFSQPYNKQFTWRFRTKTEKCVTDHATVSPAKYTAKYINDRKVYNVQPYSSPDACAPGGQKLDAWSVNWAWSSSDNAVATVPYQFSTVGQNSNCTAQCLRKGSDIPAGNPVVAVCGNNVVEAGEDCDSPNSNNCSLDCRRTGNTNIARCGNGTVEHNLGEQCDWGDKNIGSGCAKECYFKGNNDKATCGNAKVEPLLGEECDVKDPATQVGCSDVCVLEGNNDKATCGNAKVEPLLGEECDVKDPATQVGCGANCKWSGDNVCGNGVVESLVGEACDPKDPLTMLGCASNCLRTGSKPANLINSPDVAISICGNGKIGSGEDCDTGIVGGVANSQSALNCTASCLHQGTHLAKAWCNEVINSQNYFGFEPKTVLNACGKSYSQCGDNILDASEDEGCEGPQFNNNGEGNYNYLECNKFCLKKQKDSASDIIITFCGENPKGLPEGCNSNLQHQGSSLVYSVPSLCGDDIVGIGEDATCETNLGIAHKGLIDPWTLAQGVGQGIAQGDPKQQEANIIATTRAINKDVSGSGKFIIACGYKTDAECWAATNNPTMGVGADTCCYERPQIVSSLPTGFPPPEITPSNICPNTAISVTFDKAINPATVSGNLLIARGLIVADPDNVDPTICPEKVTSLVTAQGAANQIRPWYSRVLAQIVNFVKNLFGNTAAAIQPVPNVWCAGKDTGVSSVFNILDNNGEKVVASRVSVALDKPLSTDANYTIILKEGIKDTRGVSIGRNGLKNYSWKFNTAVKICEVTGVTVTPPEAVFSRVGASVTLAAEAEAQDGQPIQPINGFYAWNYIWGPDPNDFVALTKTTVSLNKIAAKNKNGETDIRAAASITDNAYSSAAGIVATGNAHIIVFLCENPWPPKDLYLLNDQNEKTGPFIIFPYEDSLTNKAGFNLDLNTFNNQPIPPSAVDIVGDGYYNFRTYYCADKGGAGVLDDLPYLRPVVQTAADALVSSKGNCEYTGVACTVSAECGTLYNINSVVFATLVNGDICVGKNKDGTNIVYLDNKSQPLVDCQTPAYLDWVKKNGYVALAIPLPNNGKSLSCFQHRPLKRFFLTNKNNNDVIGIQIFDNPKHLTPTEWYTGENAAGGQEFSGALADKQIDGYSAVTDGNNIYVDALNYAEVAKNLANNIYVFSINNNATADSRAVFEQLLTNLKFNSNLTNYGYCGKTIANPNFTTTCKNDFDCAAGEVCSAQTDKLKRDYLRLINLNSLQTALAGYANANNGEYPALNAGTYLQGQTISTWQSWSVLGGELGKYFTDKKTLAIDPINRLAPAGTCASSTHKFCVKDDQCGLKPEPVPPPQLPLNIPDTCVLHDPITGWSTANARYSFACAPQSFAIRYIYNVKSPKDYKARTRFEDPGIEIDNGNSFINDFVNQSHFSLFDPQGICQGDQEVLSAINEGKCGDGIVNLKTGEECEPPSLPNKPGKTVYGVCDTNQNSAHYNEVEKKVCDDKCQWGPLTYPKCESFSVCGNGVLEAGETCDDGKLNGRYNHCDAPLQRSQDPNDPVSLGCRSRDFAGSCGNNNLEPVELCDPTNELNELSSAHAGNYIGWCTAGLEKGSPCVGDSGAEGCDYIIQPGVCLKLSDSKVKYSFNRATSCGVDCQSYGPYCGDNIVQTKFGEDCDGTQVCNVGGKAGKKECSQICEAYDTSALGWWRLDKMSGDAGKVGFFVDSAVDNSARGGGNGNEGNCDSGKCPTLVTDGVLKNAFKFDGKQTYIAIPAAGDILMPANTLSVEAWVRPDVKYEPDYAQVIDKGMWGKDGGYGLQFWKDTGRISFIIFSSSTVGKTNYWLVNSSTSLPVGKWTHVVGTYSYVEQNKKPVQTIKLYINGEEDTAKNYSERVLVNAIEKDSNVITNAKKILISNDYNLQIGRSYYYDRENDEESSGNYFTGALDEVKIFDRVLTDAEVKEHYQNAIPCEVAATQPVVVAPKGICGDKTVDEDEQCDNGVKTVDNDLVYNGKECTVGYEKGCSYCTADCKIVDKRPTQYCGDGIIEAKEVCDTDPVDSKVYAAKQSATTTSDIIEHNGYLVKNCSEENVNPNMQEPPTAVKYGARQCINKCSQIAVKETNSDQCILCGLDPKGVEVTGSVVNVLNPKWSNPLRYVNNGKNNNVEVINIYAKNVVPYLWFALFQTTVADNSENGPMLYSFAPIKAVGKEPALIGANPICNNYLLSVNNSTMDFSAVGYKAPTWQYDLVLSPVISAKGLYYENANNDIIDIAQSARPNDIRVVIKYRGAANFYPGFVIPVDSDYTTNEGPSFNKSAFNYYKNNDLQINGIWYHDYGSTFGKTHVESFTVDTSALSQNEYMFYVRSNINTPENAVYKLGQKALLQVELYAPKDVGRHLPEYSFDKPFKTFVIDADTVSSDNTRAGYWQVFNITKLVNGAPVISTINEVNKIKSIVDVDWLK